MATLKDEKFSLIFFRYRRSLNESLDFVNFYVKSADISSSEVVRFLPVSNIVYFSLMNFIVKMC